MSETAPATTTTTTVTTTTVTATTSSPPVLSAADQKIADNLLKQVEFYFSDSNLPKDKFLRGLAQAGDGWVPISTIATFKRMRQLTTDLNLVTNALKQSKELLEVSADGTKVRRATELPPDIDKIASSRTIYAKGLDASSTIESVTELFSAYGSVRCVRLRRLKAGDKAFKGSVFVEFGSDQEAKDVVSKEIKLPGKDEPLQLQLKDDYFKKKKEQAEAKKADKKKAEKEKEDSKKSKKRKGKEEQTTKAKNKKMKIDENGNLVPDETAEKKDGEEDNKDEEKEEMRYKKNLIIKISELKEGTDREAIQGFFKTLNIPVGFVDFSRGKTEGYVRVHESAENGATGAIEKAKASSENINEKPAKDIKFTVLEGEEEEKYWKELNAKQQQNKAKRKKGGKGQGGKGRGGKGKGGGRGKGKKQKKEKS